MCLARLRNIRCKLQRTIIKNQPARKKTCAKKHKFPSLLKTIPKNEMQNFKQHAHSCPNGYFSFLEKSSVDIEGRYHSVLQKTVWGNCLSWKATFINVIAKLPLSQYLKSQSDFAVFILGKIGHEKGELEQLFIQYWTISSFNGLVSFN